MLIRVHNGEGSQPRAKSHYDEASRLENMTITYYSELALLLQSIDAESGTFTVTHSHQKQSLVIPLEPDVTSLAEIKVSLHGSDAKAYEMDNQINSWFSNCFEFKVVLAYLGPNRRSALGSLPPNAAPQSNGGVSSWLSTVTRSLPNLGPFQADKGESSMGFADVAAYLVVTEESLKDISSRLSDGKEMDMTKFRPNIVLSGALEAWDEDFWGGITITSSSSADHRIQLVLTANCGRCVSINIDYSTGQPALGEEGSVLKKMMKDRRVDKGSKYSPIFGRYGFLEPGTSGAGQRIAVGDAVEIYRRNEERTRFGGWSTCKLFNANIKQNGPDLVDYEVMYSLIRCRLFILNQSQTRCLLRRFHLLDFGQLQNSVLSWSHTFWFVASPTSIPIIIIIITVKIGVTTVLVVILLIPIFPRRFVFIILHATLGSSGSKPFVRSPLPRCLPNKGTLATLSLVTYFLAIQEGIEQLQLCDERAHVAALSERLMHKS